MFQFLGNGIFSGTTQSKYFVFYLFYLGQILILEYSNFIISPTHMQAILNTLQNVKTSQELQNLVLDITQKDGVFVFGEILESPVMGTLKENTDCKSSYRTIELFSFGTFQDYTSMKKSRYNQNEIFTNH